MDAGRYDAALFALPNREGTQFHTLLLVVVGLICWLSEQYFRIKVRKRMETVGCPLLQLKECDEKNKYPQVHKVVQKYYQVQQACRSKVKSCFTDVISRISAFLI